MLFLYKGETFLKSKASVLSEVQILHPSCTHPLHQEQSGTCTAAPLTASLFTSDTGQCLQTDALPPTHGNPVNTLHCSMEQAQRNKELWLHIHQIH